MSKTDKRCQMCGAQPGEPCIVISGDPTNGVNPGDVRSEPHFYRGAGQSNKPTIVPLYDADLNPINR